MHPYLTYIATQAAQAAQRNGPVTATEGTWIILIVLGVIAFAILYHLLGFGSRSRSGN